MNGCNLGALICMFIAFALGCRDNESKAPILFYILMLSFFIVGLIRQFFMTPPKPNYLLIPIEQPEEKDSRCQWCIDNDEEECGCDC